MSQINVNKLTFCYEGSYDTIFEDVSFRIDTDWKLGFVAGNGRGKTTFLNLLRGKYEYKGTIGASVKFDYFPFEITDGSKDVLSVIEEIYSDCELWKICRELTLLSVDSGVLYRPYETLSNGEQTKVMLAVLFSRDNNFLLIDEPTNHLDAEARKTVSAYLKKKKGFILVSHDRVFLDACIDHVLVINRANIEVVQGNFSSWWENKQRRDSHELAENERLKKDIGKLKEAARQARQWGDKVESTKLGKKAGQNPKHIDNRAYIGEKSRRMQMRRKNLEKRETRAIEEKSTLLKNIEKTEELKLFPLRHHKDVLVRLENVGLSYGAEAHVIEGLHFEIRRGERVILQGRNGCGKTSILRAILSAAAPLRVTGSIETASGLIISYVPQDTAGLCGNLSDYAKAYEIDETLFKTLLRKMDFTRVQFEKDMVEYSAGQKKKVLLARSLCERAHLYVWDEPLNFIDVFSRMQIEELIRKYNPTMLMVEHDRTFAERTDARTITL